MFLIGMLAAGTIAGAVYDAIMPGKGVTSTSLRVTIGGCLGLGTWAILKSVL